MRERASEGMERKSSLIEARGEKLAVQAKDIIKIDLIVQNEFDPQTRLFVFLYCG